MEIAQYHKLRRAVQTNAAPGTARELRAVKADLQAALASVGLFEDVEVDYTDDLDHLVIAMVTFPEQLNRSEVAARLELMWQDRLRYPFWEAHSTRVDDDQVEFQGATRAGSTGHYVTLHIVAQMARVPAQRAASD
jgi:predicted ABC-class ATPase